MKAFVAETLQETDGFPKKTKMVAEFQDEIVCKDQLFRQDDREEAEAVQHDDKSSATNTVKSRPHNARRPVVGQHGTAKTGDPRSLATTRQTSTST